MTPDNLPENKHPSKKVEEAFNYCAANIGTLTRKQHPVTNDKVAGDLNLGM